MSRRHVIVEHVVADRHARAAEDALRPYYFVDVSHYGDATALCRRILERRNVVTIPGDAFGERGRGYVRISFAADRETIIEGVRRIGEELRCGDSASARLGLELE